MENVKSFKSQMVNLNPENYQRLRRFGVMTIDTKEKLVVLVEEGKEQKRD